MADVRVRIERYSVWKCGYVQRIVLRKLLELPFGWRGVPLERLLRSLEEEGLERQKALEAIERLVKRGILGVSPPDGLSRRKAGRGEPRATEGGPGR